jgi:hypothetical protein
MIKNGTLKPPTSRILSDGDGTESVIEFSYDG